MVQFSRGCGLEVGTVLAVERGVVVDQRAEADCVVLREQPPPAASGPRSGPPPRRARGDEDVLQLARRDRAEVLQRGELGLVAVGDDDDQCRQVAIVAPALGLLDLGREDVVLEARLLRRRLAALAQVGDPQFDAFVAQCRERVEQRLGSGAGTSRTSTPTAPSRRRTPSAMRSASTSAGVRPATPPQRLPSGRVVTIVRPSAYALA